MCLVKPISREDCMQTVSTTIYIVSCLIDIIYLGISVLLRLKVKQKYELDQ